MIFIDEHGQVDDYARNCLNLFKYLSEQHILFIEYDNKRQKLDRLIDEIKANISKEDYNAIYEECTRYNDMLKLMIDKRKKDSDKTE